MNVELARVDADSCVLNIFSSVTAVFCQLKITITFSLKCTSIGIGDIARLSTGTEYFMLKVTLANFSINFSGFKLQF